MSVVQISEAARDELDFLLRARCHIYIGGGGGSCSGSTKRLLREKSRLEIRWNNILMYAKRKHIFHVLFIAGYLIIPQPAISAPVSTTMLSSGLHLLNTYLRISPLSSRPTPPQRLHTYFANSLRGFTDALLDCSVIIPCRRSATWTSLAMIHVLFSGIV